MNFCCVFPGQGSQSIGMARDFYDSFQEIRDIFNQASDVLAYDVVKICFEGPKEELDKTFITQPCLLTAEVASFTVLKMHNLSPNFVAGHSLGEYSALVSAGSIEFKDAVKITYTRGKLMQEAVPEGKGAMAAILGLDRAKVNAICAETSGYVAPANYNCPGQIVISGEKESVAEASKKAIELGAMRAITLNVSVPSHSMMMKKMSETFEQQLSQIEIRKPNISFINNVDAIFIDDPVMIRQSLIRQLYSPVLWEDCVKMICQKTTTFIETGPGKVLSGLIKRIDKNAKIYNADNLESIKQIRRRKIKTKTPIVNSRDGDPKGNC
ncbi:MAG: ACP S-malonyltransferase, partial [Thermodesulfovibrionales bacterium]|nr:ACP S-malonyltransferase [Thermodesulfovibrionales bacterium]